MIRPFSLALALLCLQCSQGPNALDDGRLDVGRSDRDLGDAVRADMDGADQEDLGPVDDGADGGQPPAPMSLRIEPNVLVVDPGSSTPFRVIAEGEDPDVTAQADVFFTSEGVVEIGRAGRVDALAQGSSILVASFGGLEATAVVNVGSEDFVLFDEQLNAGATLDISSGRVEIFDGIAQAGRRSLEMAPGFNDDGSDFTIRLPRTVDVSSYQALAFELRGGDNSGRVGVRVYPETMASGGFAQILARRDWASVWFVGPSAVVGQPQLSILRAFKALPLRERVYVDELRFIRSDIDFRFPSTITAEAIELAVGGSTNLSVSYRVETEDPRAPVAVIPFPTPFGVLDRVEVVPSGIGRIEGDRFIGEAEGVVEVRAGFDQQPPSDWIAIRVGSPPEAPNSAPDAPSFSAAEVLALFSNAYPEQRPEPLDSAGDFANVEVVPFGEEEVLQVRLLQTRRFADLDFAGERALDLGSFDRLVFDLFTDGPRDLTVELVRPGPDGELGSADDEVGAVNLDRATTPGIRYNRWHRIELELSRFGLDDLDGIERIGLRSESIRTLFIDNVLLLRR